MTAAAKGQQQQRDSITEENGSIDSNGGRTINQKSKSAAAMIAVAL